MSEDETLKNKISQLESRLDSALKRIEGLESQYSMTIDPPPVTATAFQFPKPSDPITQVAQVEVLSTPETTLEPNVNVAKVQPEYSPQLNPTQLPAKSRDFALLEYNLGAKVLPWTGAILTIIALGIFISMGIERGLITPAMQLGGAILISLGFIFAGFKKHEEKEDFGKILIAVGSCGMFISLAGGHVFLKLYVGEVMIGLFVAWSAINLIYGQRTKSVAFVLLGFFGGMIASLMPMSELNATASMILQFLILIPSMLIAVKQLHKELVALFWAVGFVTLLSTIVLCDLSEFSFLALVIHSLVAIVTYMFAFKPDGFDPSGNFSSVIPFTTSVAILAVNMEWNEVVLLLSLGIPLLALAALKRNHQLFGKILASGIGITFVLSPLSLPGLFSTYVFILISLLASGIILKKKADVLLPVVWLDLSFGVLSYLLNQQMTQVLAPFSEPTILISLSVTIVLACYTTSKVRQTLDPIAAFGMISLIPLLSRLFWVMGESISRATDVPLYSVCFGLIAYLLVLTKLLGKNSLVMRAILWGILTLIGLIYVNSSSNNLPITMPIQITLCAFGFGVITMLGLTTFRESTEKRFTIHAVLIVLTATISRFFWVAGFAIQPTHDSATISLAFGLLLFALAIGVISEKAKTPVRAARWGILSLAFTAYLRLVVGEGMKISSITEVGFLVSLIAVVMIQERNSFRNTETQDDQYNLNMVLGVITMTLGRIFWIAGWTYRSDVQLAQVWLCYGLLGLLFLLTQLFGSRVKSVRLLLWSILAASGAVYWNLFETVQPGLAYEIPFMLAGLVAMYWLGWLELRDAPEKLQNHVLIIVGVPFGFALARVFALIMTQTAMGASKVNGSTMALALVSAIAAAMVYRRARLAYGGLMWLFAAASLASTARLVALDPPMEAVILMLIMLTFSGWASTKLEPIQQFGPVVAMLLNWYFFSRFIGLVIGENVVMNHELTKTLSWVAYAILLLIIGFWRDQRTIRFGAIALFAGSTLKMFLYDLVQQMDTLARVAILFLLGFAMLAAGYWYLRSRVIEHPVSVD